MSRESDLNPFLKGNFAPWRMEGDAEDLEVVGELPRDLRGTFVRNGPNAAFEPNGRYHWFDGDGMIHAITIADGRASYRNRYVRSEGLAEERAAGRATFPGLVSLSMSEGPRFKNTANTNVVFHAGKLYALVESSPPTLLRPGSLDTVGVYDFDGKLAGPMTAHPKLDPVTGEMVFFGYSAFPPHLQVHVADATGALVRSEVIDVAWPSMMHDFAITRDHVIFILCPVVIDFESAMNGGGLFSWQPERGAKLGVMPRAGGNADVRWFDLDACFVFHPMNAYDEGRTIVLDVARYEQLLFMAPSSARTPDWRDKNVARLHRWTIDLERGTVGSTPLDAGDGEFPRVDERRVGSKHRFGYMAVTGPEGNSTLLPEFTAIRKYDLERASSVTRAFGPGNGAGEPLFVPRSPDADEDDGWVIALVYDKARNASDFYVLDAHDISADPVASVRLPHRVPYGFHGNWVAG